MQGTKEQAALRGSEGENLAASYLELQGLKVRERHYFTRYGEIDLICQDRDNTWVFVEVKTRTRFSNPTAAESITPAKQKKIVGCALSYMKRHGLADQQMRFDVVLLEDAMVEWIPAAFEPAVDYSF